jgi:hypothetical protein
MPGFLFHAVGNYLGKANILQSIGDVRQFDKEPYTALRPCIQAPDLFCADGDRLGEANTLQATGYPPDVRRPEGLSACYCSV